MAATFYPELGEDTRVLQMFLGLCARDGGSEVESSLQACAPSDLLGFPSVVLR